MGTDLLPQTLDAFIGEAGLSADAGATGPGDWTLERILEEKKRYDASLNFEKKPSTEDRHGWALPGQFLVPSLSFVSRLCLGLLLHSLVATSRIHVDCLQGPS